MSCFNNRFANKCCGLSCIDINVSSGLQTGVGKSQLRRGWWSRKFLVEKGAGAVGRS